MQCQNAMSLVPSYLDGELLAERAGPLRRHLLGCAPCREAAKAQEHLSRWFVAGPKVEVPAGFAAAVARRAFAGAEPWGEAQEAVHTLTSRPPGDRSRSFVLALTAAAAAVLLLLSVAIRQMSLPDANSLTATEPVEDVLDELRRLNEAEAALEAPPGEGEAGAEPEGDGQ